jgi:hypothetical protein
MLATQLLRLAAGALLAAAFLVPVQAATSVIVSAQPARPGQSAARERQFARLVSERARAIEATFGNPFSPWVSERTI